MNVEARLLSKILLEADLRPVLDAKVRPEFFQDPDHADLYRWFLEYYERHGMPPTPGALKRNYPTFKVIKTPEPFSYLLDELFNARRYAILHDAVAESAAALKVEDSEAAERFIAEAMALLAADLSPLRDINLTDPAYIAQWIAEYEEKEKFDGSIIGLPTGFPTIDKATSGLRPEQLVTLVGEPKAGKSTGLLLMTKAVHDYGRRPLFVGFEMSNDETKTRYAAVRANVDYHRLDRGKLNENEKKRFYKALREMEGTPDLILTADPSATSTLSGLISKVETYKPDALFVDGLYLMLDEVTGEVNTPQALTNITRGLKRLAQRYRIPIVGTTQVLTWKFNRKKGITTDSIGYSSSFAQDSDVIFGLESTEDDDIKKLRVVAARNMRNRIVHLHWSWSTRQFEEMESAPEDDDEFEDL